MQKPHKHSLLGQPILRACLDRWCESSGQSIVHHHDVLACCAAFSAQKSVIVFVGWNTQAPAESAKHLSLINADVHAGVYIVVLADKESDAGIINAVQLGADRFICCDTPVTIVDAVIEALERRISPADHLHHYPPYRLDEHTRAVNFGLNRIVLTQREFQIAHYLFEHHDQALSRKSLLKDIWNLPPLDHDRRVDTQMSNLRRKLQLNGSFGWSLRFPYRMGYQLQNTFGPAAQNQPKPVGKSATLA